MSKDETWTTTIQAWGPRNATYYASQSAPHTAHERQRIYRVTVEDITPEPEEPQWWNWSSDSQEWNTITNLNRILPSAYEDGSCVVWGTTEDRDEKRYALRDAQRKAGKP